MLGSDGEMVSRLRVTRSPSDPTGKDIKLLFVGHASRVPVMAVSRRQSAILPIARCGLVVVGRDACLHVRMNSAQVALFRGIYFLATYAAARLFPSAICSGVRRRASSSWACTQSLTPLAAARLAQA